MLDEKVITSTTIQMVYHHLLAPPIALNKGRQTEHQRMEMVYICTMHNEVRYDEHNK